MEKDIPKHHVKQELCTTRPSYRDGRRLTTVKVYTVAQESKYLLIQNVPAVGAKEDLTNLLSTFGVIADLHPLDDYPADKFTEVYRVKYQRIQSARFAKKKLDDQSFFGGSLHISYAPEYETVKETREKLQDRRRVIAAKIRQLDKESAPDSTLPTSSSIADIPDNDQMCLPSTQQALALPSPVPPPQPPPPPPPPPYLSVPLPPPPSLSVPPPPAPLPNSSASAAQFQNSLGVQNSRRVPPMGGLEVPHHGYNPSYPTEGPPGGDVVTDSEGLQDAIFHIPPPPMPGVSFDAMHYRTPHFSRENYGFAWVPSANSAFPPGYDPRLPPEGCEDSGVGVTQSLHQDGHQDRGGVSRQIVPAGNSASPSKQQGPDQSSEQTVKSSSAVPGTGGKKIVIKQFKPKGPPPRFVPRQIKDGKETSAASSGSSAQRTAAKAQDDEVNRRIRQDAFRLGADQGPSLPSDPETRKQLLGQRPLVEPKVEASVISSVRDIRKRLTKFISETVPKKLRSQQAAKTVTAEKSLSEKDVSTQAVEQERSAPR